MAQDWGYDPKRSNMSRKDEQRPAEPDALDNQGQDRPGSQHNTGNEETPIYLTSNSTLQTGEEHRHDQQTDPRQDNRTEVNHDDQREVRLGRLTGRDENDSDKA
jgi:hypothetical protein